MTKRIRIENADPSTHKVVVEVWQRGPVKLNGDQEPDRLVRVVPIDYPTALIEETIWLDRYLVVKEVE